MLTEDDGRAGKRPSGPSLKQLDVILRERIDCLASNLILKAGASRASG